MMFKRAEYERILQRVREPRRLIQVVTGPRQVGKTTVVHQVLEDSGIPGKLFNADAVPATQGNWIGQCWQRARLIMQGKGYSEFLLVIDEIQKISGWSEFVKREWDADTLSGINIKVILLGSSRAMLARGLSESLMGRFEEIRMGHWRYAEMRSAFGCTLESYIFYGGYPGAAFLTDDVQRWKDYIRAAMVEATVQRDILVDAPVGKPALLRQLFEVGATYSGKLLALNKMLGMFQDAGNTVTLSGYLRLLNDSGLLAGLQKFSADEARKRASIPKYQLYNNAFLSIYIDSTLDAVRSDPVLWGQYVESAVGVHLLNEAFVHRFEVYYWRERDLEVDFVLRHHQKVIAIKVKSNSERWNKGLEVFEEKFHPHASMVVGSSGIDLETFLTMDMMSLFG